MAATEDRVMDHPIIKRVAAFHGKSVVQVLLRWAVQRGTVAIPKTQNPVHLAENIEIYEDAMHGWVPTDGRAHHPEQSKRAWGRMLALFEAQLAG